MKFDFESITEDGLHVELDDSSWLPAEFVFEGSVVATAFCRKQKSGNILVQGKFRAIVIPVCDRCLEEFRMPLDVEFKVDVELEAVDAQESDHHCRETEMETCYVAKPEVDLFQIFQQQVLLSMPMKALCSVECHGLCKQCGINLNLYPEKCQCEEESNSPFKILARIKEK